MAEEGKGFIGSNFKATLKDLETKIREAASNLEFATAARLRDEIKRLKMLGPEFANEVVTGAGGRGGQGRAEAAAGQGENGGGGAVQEGAVVGADWPLVTFVPNVLLRSAAVVCKRHPPNV